MCVCCSRRESTCSVVSCWVGQDWDRMVVERTPPFCSANTYLHEREREREIEREKERARTKEGDGSMVLAHEVPRAWHLLLAG